MHAVVSLSGGTLVTTHYGLYNPVSGITIALGSLATGAVWETSASRLRPPWRALSGVGAACPPP
ncbi:hypothetical protein [Streptomyces sp. 3213.3]|uniref:hypothetical protein n=1 Tax=Streptomyces sp. 3213.3 TaxID=1855348 RepID=UPI00190EF6A8|nr:hypothetical protein [Streptomyces sp. 3213.3]